ncbi:MAG: LPS export ABC transporter periplasmic protein LptC [Desulfococcaceae bacterium]
MTTENTRRRTRFLRRATGWGMFLALAGLFAALAGLRFWDDAADDLGPSIQSEVGMAASRVKQTAIRDGLTDWKLDAAGAKLAENGELAVVDRPEVVFFMENGENITLTANEGRLRTGSHDLRVSGEVVIRDEAYRLETEELRYQHEARRLISETPVTLSGEAMTLESDRAELDLEAGRATFQGNVKGTFGDDFPL